MYQDSPSTVNEAKTRPADCVHRTTATQLHLPEFRDVVRTLDQVVDVDYYIPGCPPTPKLTKAAVGALLAGKLPPKGSVLAPDIALCDECPRKDSKPTDLGFTEFKRPHQVDDRPGEVPPGAGLRLHGPGHARRLRGACASRATCPAPAVSAPRPGCRDQGAKILSSLAANIAPKEEAADRPGPGGHPRPGGDVLPLRAGQLAAPQKGAEARVNAPTSILRDLRHGPPRDGGGLARLFRLRIGAKLELSFLLIIILISVILSLVGTWVIGDRFVEQAQEKVGTDLNSAREIYQNNLLRISDAIRFVSDRDFVRSPIPAAGGRDRLLRRLTRSASRNTSTP